MTPEQCPFCGEHAIEIIKQGDALTVYKVVCVTCFAASRFCAEEETSIKAWNKRASSPKTSEPESPKSVVYKAIGALENHLVVLESTDASYLLDMLGFIEKYMDSI